MDASTETICETIVPVDEFSLDLADDRAARFDTLLHRGRPVTDVEARLLEAQFRLPDGSTLLLLNDDTPFKELLTLVLVGPALTVLDRLQVGGAFTPGFLTTAYPCGPDEVAFCWHDRDQVVTIRHHTRWFGLRSVWLTLRDVAIVAPVPVAVDAVTLSSMIPTLRLPRIGRQRPRRGRAMPALLWLAWLRLRTVRLRPPRKQGRARTR